jgi:uncharacterized LabA/DUF88 family protein
LPARYAIFVDAAFLWASAGEVLYGTNDRARLTCAHESLLEAMIARTGQHSRRELLRVYWYDGAVNKVPTPDQRRLGLVPDVKLRLGRVVSGHQKGVDSLIVLDLLRLSGTGMVDTIYLLSGDDDLTEGVREAQAAGVRLVLVGAATAVPRHSEALVLEADGVELWGRDFWAPHFSLAGAGAGASGRSFGAGPSAAGTAAGPVGLGPRPTSAGSGRSGPGGRDGRDGTRNGNGGPAVVEAVRTFERVGYAFARRWLSEVGSDQHERVRRSRPRIPADIDARLLWDTSAGRDLSEGERVALRDGFWRALDEQSAPRADDGPAADDELDELDDLDEDEDRYGVDPDEDDLDDELDDEDDLDDEPDDDPDADDRGEHDLEEDDLEQDDLGEDGLDRRDGGGRGPGARPDPGAKD